MLRDDVFECDCAPLEEPDRLPVQYRCFLTEPDHSNNQSVDIVRLTSRERRVIALIGEGRTDMEIATRLWITLHTVRSDVRNIVQTLVRQTFVDSSEFIVVDCPRGSSN
jgi:DNA-binding CsgD family transcriptional regulator